MNCRCCQRRVGGTRLVLAKLSVAVWVVPHRKDVGTFSSPFERATRTPYQGEAPPYSDGRAHRNRLFRPSGGGGGGFGWTCVLQEGSFLKRFIPGLLTAESQMVLLPIEFGWAAQISVVLSRSAAANVRRRKVGRFPSVAGCKRRFPLRLK